MCYNFVVMSNPSANSCNGSHEHIKEFPDVLQDILCKRGICGGQESQDFLNPDYSKLHDPFLFKDMHKATERILQAIDRDEKIAIYSDFDADGIPGGIILKDFFERISYTNFINYIPHRNKEGYGFHKEAVEKLAKEDVNLVVTVDVGISAVETVKRAKELGIDVIITDHHEADQLPEALAIINPKVSGETYPFDGLCGAGVAFKLVQALFAEGKKRLHHKISDIPDGWEKWLLDMVAIATISDMVPLIDENRILVYWGLVVLQKSKRPGLGALLQHLRIPQKLLEENDVAFSITPKVNVASRLGDPADAFNLFTAKTSNKAQKYILELERLNKSRQTEVAKITREVKKRLKAREVLGEVFLTGDKSWNPALLGLSAGKVADELGIVVCLWGQDESGVFKGSCRNGGSGHVAQLLQGAREHLIEFGGHEGAGGFSVDFEKLLQLEEEFNKVYKTLSFTRQGNRILADATLHPSNINWNFYKYLRMLGPFGMANRAPIFEFDLPEPLMAKTFGKNNEHIKILIPINKNGKTAEAVAFFAKEDWKTKPVRKIFGSIEKNHFAGRLSLRVKIMDLQ